MKIGLCRTGFEDTGYVGKEWLNMEKKDGDRLARPVLQC